MPTVHNFVDSKIRGDRGEEIVADYFSKKGYSIRFLTVPEQKELLYDLHLTRKDGKEFKIEVKTEFKAERTNNVFWETQVNGKPGWTQKYDENSDVKIIWVLPYSRYFYIAHAKHLKNFPYAQYPLVPVFNTGFKAEGHLVPLCDLKSICKTYRV